MSLFSLSDLGTARDHAGHRLRATGRSAGGGGSARALLIGGFIVRCLSTPAPLLRLRPLHDRTFAAGLATQIATRRPDRVIPRLVIVSGIIVAAPGPSLFTTELSPDTPYWILCAAMAVSGVGVGMVLMPVNTTATRDVAAADAGSATTLLHMPSQAGSAVGIATMSVVLTWHSTVVVGTAQQSDAYQYTYWRAVALLALATGPALLLPTGKRRPERGK